MNVLLVGDFINAGSRFCGEFKGLKSKKVNVLFCSYAFETAMEYNNAQKNALKRAFNVERIIDLTEDYDFSDKIDVIFVNGGYGVFNVIKKLVDNGHDKKIKNLVKKGALYIGESTGAVVAGTVSNWQVFFETDPNLLNMDKKYKKFKGLGFVDGVPVVHMSRYRFPKNFVDDTKATYRILNRTSKGVNPFIIGLKRIKKLNQLGEKTISIKENEGYLIVDGVAKRKLVNWSKLPVKENVVTDAEKKIKQLLGKK